jgi:NAD(P)-dependent dehydrogenase (short-subunit alcohol dehydrogenase family)
MIDERASTRVWFITGTSSRCGRSVAEEALARGERDVATARRPRHRRGSRRARRRPSPRAAAQRPRSGAAAAGRRRVRGALRANRRAGEQRRPHPGRRRGGDDRGRAACAVRAPLLRPRRIDRRPPDHAPAGSRAIVQMSSVGGQVTAPGFGAYCATEFALEGLSQTLADEVAPFGIRVLIVEPGIESPTSCRAGRRWGGRQRSRTDRSGRLWSAAGTVRVVAR